MIHVFHHFFATSFEPYIKKFFLLLAVNEGDTSAKKQQDEASSSASTLGRSMSETPSCSTQTKWTDDATKHLLDLVAVHHDQVGPYKKFRNKKAMWNDIAKKILEAFKTTITGAQCESRMKTLKLRKDNAVIHNRTSGNNRVDVPYRDEIEKIKLIDDSCVPEVKASIGKFEILKKREIHEIDIDETKDKKEIKKKSKEDPFIAAFKEAKREKEENRERRHREKMELLEKLLVHK